MMGKVLLFESPSAGDEHRGDAGWDGDAEIGELSSAGAEQVTVQIRAMVERAWEYIAVAYQGRAHLALGYRTWDEYVDARLGDLRLTVPREERAEAVTRMSNARMSVRAIAKVLGVGIGTVHRGLAGSAPSADAGDGATIQGRDGKNYRRRAKDAVVQECSICGDTHPESGNECPWDQFAQGLGPRPESVVRAVDALDESRSPASAQDHDARPCDVEHPHSTIPESVQEAVVRALCVLDELDDLKQLVNDIECTNREAMSNADELALLTATNELTARLRAEITAMAEVLESLERFADDAAGNRARP